MVAATRGKPTRYLDLDPSLSALVPQLGRCYQGCNRNENKHISNLAGIQASITKERGHEWSKQTKTGIIQEIEKTVSPVRGMFV